MLARLIGIAIAVALLAPLALDVRSAAAQEAGWYEGGDGCDYWWDGYQYTGDYDCSAAGSTGYAAGWYDGGDGCLYYFDGYDYTGDYDCSANAGWVAGDDGCYYWWDGYEYTTTDCSALAGWY